MLRLSGLLLLRLATRRLFQLLFQLPPRSTLCSACPQAYSWAPCGPGNLPPTALRTGFLFSDFALPTSYQPAEFVDALSRVFQLVDRDAPQIVAHPQVEPDFG